MTEGTTQSTEQRAASNRRLVELINGYQASAAIGALARLGVADALADGPSSITELARRLGADERAFARLLDATRDIGLFTIGDDGRCRLGDLGDLLRTDVPGSLHRLAVVSTDEWRWRAYGHLTHALRTGEPGFVAAHGCRLWDYLASRPDAAASFEESMVRVGAARDRALAEAVDFSAVDCLVDVGGGRGGPLCVLLAAHPHLRGVVFDLPSLIEGAKEQLREAGLAERCQAIGGDFREAVPRGGDAYLLSWILHDWDDATALRILGKCRAAMGRDARLLVVEMVVPDPNQPGAAVFERLVRQAAARGAQIVLLDPFVLPVPDDRKVWREDLEPKLEILRALSDRFGVVRIPLDQVFARAAASGDPAVWVADGVHPTPAGHAQIARAWLDRVTFES
jgi:hypothetical protein